MKINVETNESGILLPKDSLIERLEECSETEIKTLILVYSGKFTENGVFSEKGAAEFLGVSESEVTGALQFWRGAGMLRSGRRKKAAEPDKAADSPAKENSDAPKDERIKTKEIEIPQYSGIEIDRLFRENAELKSFIDTCQNVAGKIFNALELNKILALYDYFRIPPDFIAQLLSYNVSKGKRSIHYLEKTALDLNSRDINTVEALEEYIKQQEIYNGKTGKIREIFGTGARALTPFEKECVFRWTTTWEMPYDLISYAYELTVNATAKPSFSYANSILERWHSSGIKTLEKAKEDSMIYKAAHDKKNAGSPSDNSSFDTDEFFEAALKRSYENIGKKRKKDEKGD